MTGGVELVLDARAELAEGPVWDARTGRLIWLDIMRGRVHRFDPASGRSETREVGQPVGAAAPAADGAIVLAVRDGFARLDYDSRRIGMIAEVEADRPENRMNDGACDPAGRFWAGTMALDCRRGAGALYRLDPDGGVTTMLRDVTISNGIDWSDDGRVMYFIDSATQRVDAFDFDPERGAMSRRRPIVTVAPESGMPDGLTIDAEGFLWVALWGGGAVHRYSPGGALDGVIRLPVTHPTKCAFGGPDLTDLFVTTATIALSPDERARQPHAGGLFRARPGIRGRPANVFAGPTAVRLKPDSTK